MKYICPVLVICFAISFSSCKEEKKDIVTYDNGPTDSLKINEIQVLASHNSYHLRTDEDVLSFLRSLDSLGVLPAQYQPDGLDYTNIPYEQQFENYNVRGLEIDIYNDPVGGQYYNRAAKSLMGKDPVSNIPDLLVPGMKVLHIPDFDFNSLHWTFKKTLEAVRDWSNAHPNHLPIFINIETKEETVAQSLTQVPGLTQSIPFDATAANNIDVEIKDVFGSELSKVITPDNVRGSYSSLREAVLAGNWPRLSEARGKVVFIMQGEAESEYLTGHPSLQGRAMFVYASPGSAEAAFIIRNGPQGNVAAIQQLVAQGFMVRTRCDEPANEARTNDYSRMNAAFESGAQILTTDYYKADDRAGTGGWTDYNVQLPGRVVARINPVSAGTKLGLGAIKE